MTHRNKPFGNPVVVLREEFDDWAVLFNPDTADAVGINPVGVAVWKLMNGQRNFEEIVAEVQKDFSDVPGVATDEINKFLEDLAKRGFVGYELKSDN